jgi:hypothetical protein
MKIEFDDKSYIEVKKSNIPGKVIMTIGARDQQNPLKKIINSVEIDEAQFKDLISL